MKKNMLPSDLHESENLDIIEKLKSLSEKMVRPFWRTCLPFFSKKTADLTHSNFNKDEIQTVLKQRRILPLFFTKKWQTFSVLFTEPITHPEILSTTICIVIRFSISHNRTDREFCPLSVTVSDAIAQFPQNVST